MKIKKQFLLLALGMIPIATISCQHIHVKAERGLQGFQGEKGERGEPGQKGERGENGKDGKGFEKIWLLNSSLEASDYLVRRAFVKSGKILFSNNQKYLEGDLITLFLDLKASLDNKEYSINLKTLLDTRNIEEKGKVVECYTSAMVVNKDLKTKAIIPAFITYRLWDDGITVFNIQVQENEKFINLKNNESLTGRITLIKYSKEN
ncbi:collagen-like triple helix repeat-containing protein [Mycoplasma struthionis]|uniref:Collagen-like protein n=1 Tax=Mycoplasma struthionis TaxID=538220 RepID=A0A3G8LII1_9MOLU|nr:collagen-like protein [Mycoplasma struthionis]AZG68468.1 collagen-like protein [Mycoplasma struthionis]